MAVAVSPATAEPFAARRQRAHDGRRCVLVERPAMPGWRLHDHFALGDTRQVQSQAIRLPADVTTYTLLAADHLRHRAYVHLRGQGPRRHSWCQCFLSHTHLRVGDLERQYTRLAGKHSGVLYQFRDIIGLHPGRYDVLIYLRRGRFGVSRVVPCRFRFHTGIAGLSGASKSYTRSD